MTTYVVDVHHDMHTCPADPDPHVFTTTQQVVAVSASGPCRNPVTIRVGDTTATVDCGRHEPDDRRCGNCRNIIWIRKVTVTFHGYQGPAHRRPIGAVA